MEWMGANMCKGLHDCSIPGMYEILAGQTRFLDDLCRESVDAGCTQMIILGAGYDMRGFRLGLLVPCFELDQPEVQVLKEANIKLFGVSEEQRKGVHLVPVDFNKESASKVDDHPDFKKEAKTLVLMEGVTQYIPKENTRMF